VNAEQYWKRKVADRHLPRRGIAEPPISIIAMPDSAARTSDENAVTDEDAGQRLGDVAEQAMRALRERTSSSAPFSAVGYCP